MITIPSEVKQTLDAMLSLSLAKSLYEIGDFSLLRHVEVSITNNVVSKTSRISVQYNGEPLFYIYTDTDKIIAHKLEVLLTPDEIIIVDIGQYQYDITKELTEEDIFNFNIANPSVLNVINSFNKLNYKDFIIDYIKQGYCFSFITNPTCNIRHIT